MKAIITAAGRGSRLGALTKNVPKGLLPINGESIIARQLRILKSYNITDVAIVTGYKSEKIIRQFSDMVTFFFNPDYLTTTSTASLQEAMEFMDTDMIVMACDAVFPENSLQSLLDNQHEYCLLIDHKCCDSEAVKVQIVGNNVVNVGKHLPSQESFGEWAYISRIKKHGLLDYKALLRECAIDKLGRSQVFMKLIERGHDIQYEVMEGEWTEVDFVKDYIEAKRIFK